MYRNYYKYQQVVLVVSSINQINLTDLYIKLFQISIQVQLKQTTMLSTHLMIHQQPNQLSTKQHPRLKSGGYSTRQATTNTV